MKSTHGESRAGRLALERARRAMGELLAWGPRGCVEIVRAVASVDEEAGRQALLERLEAGPRDAVTVETLLEAMVAADIAPMEARLRRLAVDETRSLRVRGLAFEAWARWGDAVALIRGMLRAGPVDATSDWLIAYLAGAMVRAGAPETAARLALLLAMTGRSAQMLDLMEHVRRDVGAAATDAYAALLELPALSWARPRWLAIIDAEAWDAPLSSAA